MSSPRPISPAALGAALLAVFGCWGVVLAYALQPALPYSPIRLPYQEEVRAQLFLPEGWAFFTKSPREERAHLFERGPGGWRSASLAPIAMPRNVFGLDRAPRAQSVELGLLLTRPDVKAAKWSGPCRQDPMERCLDGVAPAARFKNPSPRPTLCGQVGIVRQAPVPWAWNLSGRKVVMPSHVLRLEVSC